MKYDEYKRSLDKVESLKKVIKSWFEMFLMNWQDNDLDIIDRKYIFFHTPQLFIV